MKSISMTVNGEQVSGNVQPRTQLADFLRGQLGLTGTHLGCEQGVCGACTVLVDGQPTRSCISYAISYDGADIRTVEGFDDDPVMADLRQAFSAHHGLQCGFCTPGMLVTARDIAARLDRPDETMIRHELAGNICRCTGYQGIVNAISSVIAANGECRPLIAGQPAAGPIARSPYEGDFPRFDRRQEAVTAPAPAAIAITMQVDADGWTVLTQDIDLDHPAASVWHAMGDVQALAICMPGARIDQFDGSRIEGGLSIKFGPIRAGFAGQAERVQDDALRRGSISGSGSDGATGTRAQGAVSYAVSDLARGRSRIAVSVRFKLAGPLAQFGRSGLVKDFAARLTEQFTANLAKLMAGEAVDASAGAGDLNAVALLWSVVKRRVLALIGR